jgi:hypothetical protein
MDKSFHLFNVQKEIEDKFNSLLKSGKMSLTLTLEESTSRRNVEINEEFDEDILCQKRDEYYINKKYTCTKCKQIKPRQEFFRLRENEEGIAHHCKVCEMKYYKKMNDKG